MSVVKFPCEIPLVFPDKGNNIIIKKSDKNVETQLVINQINLPDVLLDIIKDYIYMSIYEYASRYMKLYLNNCIHQMRIRSVNAYTMEGELIYIHVGKRLSYANTKSIQLQYIICSKCGDYCMISDTNIASIQRSALCMCKGNNDLFEINAINYAVTSYTVDIMDDRDIINNVYDTDDDDNDTSWIDDSYEESEPEEYTWTYGDNGIDWD